MFYWISYKRIRNMEWEFCEEQFYPDEEAEMADSIEKHRRNNWLIHCFKVCNKGDGQNARN